MVANVPGGWDQQLLRNVLKRLQEKKFEGFSELTDVLPQPPTILLLFTVLQPSSYNAMLLKYTNNAPSRKLTKKKRNKKLFFLQKNQKANAVKLRQIKTMYNAGEKVDYEELGQVSSCANALKAFFRELREPAFNTASYSDIIQLMDEGTFLSYIVITCLKRVYF